MEDAMWARELVKLFGWRRAAELFGMGVLLGLAGVTAEELDSSPDRVTRWRVRRDLKRFGEHMRALGYWGEGELTLEDLRGKTRLLV